jgi:pantoate--beta-alanine ligase
MRMVTDAAGLVPFHGGVFVPTMGALHAGHAALARRAREIAGSGPVVVSVFVNPTQFNEKQDFERYPRDLDRDAAVCAAAGADAVFAPSVEVMYPRGMPTAIASLPAVATEPGLEDAHRPGHFAGVCQVCRRLFELVRPRRAVFGEKDWQQLAVVRAMVAGLGESWFAAPVEIIGHETIREADGVAMSSRNMLLPAEARRVAPALARALVAAGREADARAAESAGARVLRDAGVAAEYFAVRDAATLGAVARGAAGRALVAARVGGVRLIDNAPWPWFSIG